MEQKRGDKEMKRKLAHCIALTLLLFSCSLPVSSSETPLSSEPAPVAKSIEPIDDFVISPVYYSVEPPFESSLEGWAVCLITKRDPKFVRYTSDEGKLLLSNKRKDCFR